MNDEDWVDWLFDFVETMLGLISFMGILVGLALLGRLLRNTQVARLYWSLVSNTVNVVIGVCLLLLSAALAFFVWDRLEKPLVRLRYRRLERRRRLLTHTSDYWAKRQKAEQWILEISLDDTRPSIRNVGSPK